MRSERVDVGKAPGSEPGHKVRALNGDHQHHHSSLLDALHLCSLTCHRSSPPQPTQSSGSSFPQSPPTPSPPSGTPVHLPLCKQSLSGSPWSSRACSLLPQTSSPPTRSQPSASAFHFSQETVLPSFASDPPVAVPEAFLGPHPQTDWLLSTLLTLPPPSPDAFFGFSSNCIAQVGIHKCRAKAPLWTGAPPAPPPAAAPPPAPPWWPSLPAALLMWVEAKGSPPASSKDVLSSPGNPSTKQCSSDGVLGTSHI